MKELTNDKKIEFVDKVLEFLINDEYHMCVCHAILLSFEKLHEFKLMPADLYGYNDYPELINAFPEFAKFIQNVGRRLNGKSYMMESRWALPEDNGLEIYQRIFKVKRFRERLIKKHLLKWE